MASSLPSSFTPKADEAEPHKGIHDQLRQVVSTYPTAPSGMGRPYTRHPDGWYMFTPGVVNAMVIQRHLKARDTDVFLTTFPKSGTTWLKALLYTTLRRTAHEPAIAPLTAHSPHQLVPFLESQVFINDQIPDLSSLPAPRLFMTHIPSQSLPDSIAASDCKDLILPTRVKLFLRLQKVNKWIITKVRTVTCTKHPLAPIRATLTNEAISTSTQLSEGVGQTWLELLLFIFLFPLQIFC